MPSPFPGMDPYLESPAHWSDFHHTFVTELADAVNGKLPDNYIARIDERVMLVMPILYPPGGEAYKPDVAVVRETVRSTTGGGAGLAVAMQPDVVTLENIDLIDPHTEAYLKIVRLPEHELVTVIELFSPTNKYGEGRGQYMHKRRELLHQPVNIVEIDLLRAGQRLQFSPPLPPKHYFAFVSRVEHRNRSDAFSWTVRDPMPTIPVPLKSPDRDVSLDLSKPFASTYERGRYWKLIDYAQPPPPPAFDPQTSEWLAATTRAAAGR